MLEFDVVVLGGGPGGSTLATLLVKQGYQVALVEKKEFPRFQIGESLLPFSMDILKESGFFEILQSGKYIEKYGARFVDSRTEEEIYFEFVEGIDRDHGLAFEVPRDQFDSDLLNWAKSCGVNVCQPCSVSDVIFEKNEVQVCLSDKKLKAKFVADASGRSSFLAQKFKTKKPFEGINNVAVYGHFEGVARNKGKKEGDITIGVLDDGWCWFIPFKGSVTSIGIVKSLGNYKSGDDRLKYILESLECSRVLSNDLQNAKPVGSIGMTSNYSHICEQFAGDRWLMVGDSAVFMDPIFSSGIHLSLSMAKCASEVLHEALSENAGLTKKGRGKVYESHVKKGMNRFHSLIQLFYSDDFVRQMKKALSRKELGKAFTSAFAGDVWNDENILFERGIL